MDPEEKLQSTLGVRTTIRTVQIDRYALHYLTGGKGKILLLIHGSNIGWGQWYCNIAALARHFTVYALDLPGSGYSTPVDYSTIDPIQVFPDILVRFIEKVHLKPVAIVGHSVGGWLSIKLAIQHPSITQKIVVVDPMGFTDYLPPKYRLISIPFIARLLAKTVFNPTKQNIKKYLQSVLVYKEAMSDDFINYYYHAVQKNPLANPAFFMHALTRRFKIRPDMVFGKDLERVNSDVYAILGDADPLIPTKYSIPAIKRIPHGTLKIFPNTGHVPTLEQSDICNREIITFCQKH